MELLYVHSSSTQLTHITHNIHTSIPKWFFIMTWFPWLPIVKHCRYSPRKSDPVAVVCWVSGRYIPQKIILTLTKKQNKEKHLMLTLFTKSVRTFWDMRYILLMLVTIQSTGWLQETTATGLVMLGVLSASESGWTVYRSRLSLTFGKVQCYRKN